MICSDCELPVDEHVPPGFDCEAHDDFCATNCTDYHCPYPHKCKLCDAHGISQADQAKRALDALD